MKKVTSEYISNIFYSGQFAFSGDKEITNKIAFLINEGYLIFEEVTIATKIDYLEACVDTSPSTLHYEAAGGSAEHVGLKIVASRYLKQTHGVESKFEQVYAGYFPDVQSVDNQIICECGQTNNPEKIFNYFKSNEQLKIIQIPYPNDTDSSITGYMIQATQELVPFLEYENKERAQSIKDILNRR